MDICLSCGIEVILRINYNGDSRQAEGLIDALSGHYCGKAIRPKMYIAPLYEAEEYVSAARMREIMALNERLISAQLMAFEELYSLRRRDRCFAATPWGYTLMPDGRLLNCSHNIEPQNCWGTVWDRDAENQLHRRFISDRLSEECCRCPLIPVCGGGCPAAQHGLAAMHRCIPYKSVIADILRMRLSGRQ